MSALTPRFHRISVGSNPWGEDRTKPRLLLWFSDYGKDAMPIAIVSIKQHRLVGILMILDLCQFGTIGSFPSF
jgi:hypothetical protein